MMSYVAWIVGGTIGCVIWGFIVKSVNENKGYDGGFALGFFLGVIGLIIVLSKPEANYYVPDSQADQMHSIAPIGSSSPQPMRSSSQAPVSSSTQNLVRSPSQADVPSSGWKCNQCGRNNASYTTSCACGMTQAKNKDFDHVQGSFRVCPNCKKLHPKYVFSCDCGYPDKMGSSEDAGSWQASQSPADELLQLKKLLDAGAITQEEYDKKKQELLQKM